MESIKAPPQQHIYKLLGAEPSPFTAKIRAYLKYKNVPFSEVIASENVYKDLILPLTKVSFIPILLVYDASALALSAKDGIPDPAPVLAIQDTKIMMDYFEAMDPTLFSSSGGGFMTHPAVPQSPQPAFASMVLELLGDEWLINQAIYWRWGKGNFEQQRDYLAFDYGSFAKGGLVSYDEAFSNGEKKLPRLRGVLPLLGVDDKTSPVFRSQFKQLLKLMSSHLSQYPFLLGWEISVADFAFFGSFYAHLGRDPVPSFLIKTEAPLVLEWIERVSGLVRWAGVGVERWDSGSRKWRPTYGERKARAKITDDEKDVVPSSSTRIVELLLADYVLVLKDTLNRTIQYLDEACTKLGNKRTEVVSIKLPRTLGRHNFRIGSAAGEGVVGERNVYTHSIWMLDRILDRTYSSPVQRAAADEWLETFAIQEILPEWRDCVASWSMTQWKIEREENKLVARRPGEVKSSL